MTDNGTEHDGVGGWDARKLADELSATDALGGVLHVTGVSPSTIQRDLGSLRRRLSNEGRTVFSLDPTGAAGDGKSFREVASEYAKHVEQQGKLGDASRGLVDFLASARRRATEPHDESLSGRVFTNAVCRLWKSLSERVPAVLFVFNAGECAATERDVLEHFVAEYFADPISEFVPEIEEAERVRGTLVFVDQSDELPIDVDASVVESIDVSEDARASIRETLAQENVVERFLASTGGDPERLDALIDSLPSDCENFWNYRYGQLETAEQRVVELLAVAGEPLSVECLERAVEDIGEEPRFSPTVRHLTDEGFICRKINAGTVQFQLEDADFRRMLVEALPEGRRADLHRALARAAEASQLQEVSDRFLARHYLKAGEAERGFEFGLRAARRLHGEHALDEARSLFESLLSHTEEASALEEIHFYLLDIYSGLGNFDQALHHLEALRELVDETSELRRLRCRKAKLLTQAGEYEGAEEIFEELQQLDSDDEQLDVGVILGAAENAYARGDHPRSEKLASRAVEHIGPEEGDATGTGTRAMDRLLIQARNLLGRVAIYRGRAGDARPALEKNSVLARDWGWEDELDRAEANLAVADLQDGDFSQAREALLEVLDRTPGPGSVRRASLLINLGMAHQRKGHWEESLRNYRQALRHASHADYDSAFGIAAYNLATLFQDFGAYDRATKIIEQLQERKLHEGRHLFVGTLPEILRGNLFIEREKYARAVEILSDVEIDPDSPVSSGPAAMATLRSIQAHVGLEQFEPARELLDDFELPEATSDRDRLEALHDAARALLNLENDDHESAEKLARQAAEQLSDSGFFQDSLRASLTRIRALSAIGRSEEAKSLVERRLLALHERGNSVPEDFRRSFFAVPLYREFVEIARSLDGDVPGSFERDLEAKDTAVSTANDVPSPDDAKFRKWRSRYAEIIGQDERLLKIFRRIDQVADSDSPVLVQGESGTGKELIAEAIHRQGVESSENETPFVKVNCGAFVDNLLLSELFGHEKGAFTGAVEQKVGRFEKADGGTIFLDEIGEISQKAQVALLRVLQEGEFERVGGTETKTVDARIICATNRDLESMVETGDFRLDLYYRLKGVLLELPALRERKQDIPRLVKHFADRNAEEEHSYEFTRDVLEFLASYNWPGNIRELKNFIRSILLFTDGDTVEMEHLRGFRDFFSDGEIDLDPPEIDYEIPVEDYDVEEPVPTRIGGDPEEALVEEIVADGLDLSELKKRIEMQSIRRALKETGGNITRAADILKMTRPRLSQIVNSDDSLVELKERLVG